MKRFLWVHTIKKTRLYKYTEHSAPNTESSQIKNLIFVICLLKTDCGTRKNRLVEAVLTSTHNQYILSRNKEINVYPFTPQFYFKKVGFNGGQNYMSMFSWCNIQFYDEIRKIFFSLSFLKPSGRIS